MHMEAGNWEKIIWKEPKETHYILMKTVADLWQSHKHEDDTRQVLLWLDFANHTHNRGVNENDRKFTNVMFIKVPNVFPRTSTHS